MLQERLARKMEEDGEQPMATDEISALLAKVEGSSRLRISYGGSRILSYTTVLFRIPSNGNYPIAVYLEGNEALQLFEAGWMYCYRRRRFPVQGVVVSPPLQFAKAG